MRGSQTHTHFDTNLKEKKKCNRDNHRFGFSHTVKLSSSPATAYRGRQLRTVEKQTGQPSDHSGSCRLQYTFNPKPRNQQPDSPLRRNVETEHGGGHSPRVKVGITTVRRLVHRRWEVVLIAQKFPDAQNRYCYCLVCIYTAYDSVNSFLE